MFWPMHTQIQHRGMPELSQSELYRGTLLQNVSMEKYSSWRSGGCVRQLYQPVDIDDLGDFLITLPKDEAILWFGLGSNLLVRDGGFDGTAISMNSVLDDIEVISNNRVRVEAGVPCPKVARFCAKHSMAGAEFMVGIPGTMGGALAMNAGAFGGETWDVVDSVETINRRGVRHIRGREYFDIAYRSVKSETEEWFIAAEIQLGTDHEQMAESKMREWLAKRSATQPMGQASCGSVFRNPVGQYAAQLIEECGLKGLRIGGACVSDKHANFIINEQNATAADIEQLIKHVQKVVKDRHNIELKTEVCIVGKP